MTALQAVLPLAAFLCSLVAGMLFAFAIVVMPGIKKLDDSSFIRAFQAIDRVIQNNQPVFLFVWVGSALAIVAAAVMGISELSQTDRLLVIAAAFVYVFGVQLPTVVVHIPLNNILQKLDPGAMSDAERQRERSNFEPRWNRWNAIRTACSIFASILLLLLLLRL
jgi:uncharacterized membrane protein